MGFVQFGFGVAERADVRIKWLVGNWSHTCRAFANNHVIIERGAEQASSGIRKDVTGAADTDCQVPTANAYSEFLPTLVISCPSTGTIRNASLPTRKRVSHNYTKYLPCDEVGGSSQRVKSCDAG